MVTDSPATARRLKILVAGPTWEKKFKWSSSTPLKRFLDQNAVFLRAARHLVHARIHRRDEHDGRGIIDRAEARETVMLPSSSG